MVYIENNLIDSDGGTYLSVDSLIEIKDIINGSNNITLKKLSVKAHGFDKIYMSNELVEDRLHQIIDQFNERKITSTIFLQYS